MATTATVSELFGSLSQSLTSASEATATLSALTPPEDGLSLLDVKNELLLSYLEHVAFLVLLKLRRARSGNGAEDDDLSLENPDLGQAVVKKLVELRLYLEKGVRPLEEKLRYQIEKSLRAAEDVERAAQAKSSAAAAKDGSGSDSGSGSDEDEDGDDDDDDEAAGIRIPDNEEAAASRPNRAAFVRPGGAAAAAAAAGTAGRKRDGATDKEGGDASSGGVYRPPRIAPTMMPTAATTVTTDRRDRAKGERRLKSATMDEFIADELSTAPMAELSIGTNIAGRGRHMKTSSERQYEDERRDYEERNFVRLPKESKKDRAKRGGQSGGGRMAFGGEEWHGLGEGVDRINRLTQRKSGGGGGSSGGPGGGVRSMLDKSRKRGIDTADGPRGSGMGGGVDGVVGGRFKKRLRHARDK